MIDPPPASCPKCINTSFAVEAKAVRGSAIKYLLVKCDLCGTVVGVMDYWNIGERIAELDRKLEELTRLLR
jgi:hypothetical protein